MFQIDESTIKLRANIKVVGVGGGGGNALKTMYQSGLKGVQFIAANTDLQALEEHEHLDCVIQMGAQLTKGLGAGANPEIGRQAGIESCEEIATALKDADMVFITAGMGGGTGTGSAGVIARIAKEQGALTVGVVTRPFFFEGQRRSRHAEMGIQFLKENVDTLIVIPNQKLLKTTDGSTSLLSAFKSVDHILLKAVQSIVDLINERGLINLDFADVKTIMSEKGLAIIGTGSAKGEERALSAGQMAISSPLLEDTSFKGALGLIINITGGPDLSLKEVSQTVELISAEAHPDAEIIFGSIVDTNNSSDEVKVTVIATGFDNPKNLHQSNSKKTTAPSPVEREQSSTEENNIAREETNLKIEQENNQSNPPLAGNTSPSSLVQEKTDQKPKKLPKDILMEKAMAYRAQIKNQSIEKTKQEQLSMNIPNHQEKTKNQKSFPFKKQKTGFINLFKSKRL